MLQTKNVTVSVQPMRARSRLVFQVMHVIDVGTRRPKVTLECVAYGGPGSMENMFDVDFDVPDWVAGLDLVYARTRRAKRLLPYQRIENLYESAQIEEIVTDVIRPGDLIVMQKDMQQKTSYAMASNQAKYRVYRLVKPTLNNQGRSNKHAL